MRRNTLLNIDFSDPDLSKNSVVAWLVSSIGVWLTSCHSRVTPFQSLGMPTICSWVLSSIREPQSDVAYWCNMPYDRRTELLGEILVRIMYLGILPWYSSTRRPRYSRGLVVSMYWRVDTASMFGQIYMYVNNSRTNHS